MADLLRQQIAARLLELREARGMTQAAVARAVDVSERQYQRWERAESLPYWRNIEVLAKALHVDPSSIVEPGGAKNGKPRTQSERLARANHLIADLESRVQAMTTRQTALQHQLEEALERIKALETKKRGA